MIYDLLAECVPEEGEGRVVGGGNGGGGGSSSGRCAVTIPPILVYIPPVISYRAPIFISLM